MLKETTNTTTSKYSDIQQQVTDTIIEMLEKGTIPWKMPFISNTNQFLGLPINYTTNANYNGVNIILLWLQALDKKFPTNEWATFKQWQKVKESIKPNEKATMIIKYDTFEKEVDGNIEKIPFIKKSLVFNRSQLKSFVPNKSIQLQIILSKKLI